MVCSCLLQTTEMPRLAQGSDGLGVENEANGSKASSAQMPQRSTSGGRLLRRDGGWSRRTLGNGHEGEIYDGAEKVLRSGRGLTLGGLYGSCVDSRRRRRCPLRSHLRSLFLCGRIQFARCRRRKTGCLDHDTSLERGNDFGRICHVVPDYRS